MTSAIDAAVHRGLGIDGNHMDRERTPRQGKTIKNGYLQKYFTKEDWTGLTGRSFDTTSKIRILCQRLRAIGFFC